jgi:uncharacterized protein YjeT (DUF2065 family)
MKIVIQSLGVVIVVAGIVYLLRPDIMKWLMGFFKQGKRIYFAGLIRLVLAVIFLLRAGSPECEIRWVIAVFGILFLTGGLLIFILGPEKIRRLFDWCEKQPVLLLRAMSLIALAIGAIIIYSA